MVGVDHVFIMLQPVAGDDGGAAAADRGIVGLDELAFIHAFQAVVARQHRHFLGRPHVGEDHPVALLDRIPGLSDLVLEQTALRFAGLLEAVSLGVELPAVIAAAQAVVLNLAVIQRGAAVAAAGMEQPRASPFVAEQNQILAQRADLVRRLPGIGLQTDGMPEPTQQFPHRFAAADLGQFLAL